MVKDRGLVNTARDRPIFLPQTVIMARKIAMGVLPRDRRILGNLALHLF